MSPKIAQKSMRKAQQIRTDSHFTSLPHERKDRPSLTSGRRPSSSNERSLLVFASWKSAGVHRAIPSGEVEVLGWIPNQQFTSQPRQRSHDQNQPFMLFTLAQRSHVFPISHMHNTHTPTSIYPSFPLSLYYTSRLRIKERRLLRGSLDFLGGDGSFPVGSRTQTCSVSLERDCAPENARCGPGKLPKKDFKGDCCALKWCLAS